MYETSPTPSTTPTPAPKKPRKPRTRSRSAATPTSTPTTSSVPPAGTVLGYYGGTKSQPNYPTPAWGPSYYKPRQGLYDTLTKLRASIGNDQQTSYILGDLLQARYDKQNDFRYNYFQEQADTFQHDLRVADIANQHGQPYTLPEMQVDGVPAGERPRALIKQMMADLAAAPTQDARDGIAFIYKKRLADAEDIQNDVREQKGRLTNYLRDETNTIDERGLAKDATNTTGSHAQQQTAYTAKGVNKNIMSAAQDMFSVFGGPQALSGRSQEDTSAATEPQKGITHSLLNLVAPATRLEQKIPGVDRFLDKVSDETDDPLWWAIDKLSRPLYGVNAGLESMYSNSEGSGGLLSSTLGAAASPLLTTLTGTNPFKAALDSGPKGLAKAAVAGVKGVTSGGLGNSPDPHYFHDVIKTAAEHDDTKNIYDNSNWQLWAGLGGDLVYDPLNYIGLGLVKTPESLATTGMRASIRDNVNTLRAERNSKQIAAYLKQTKHDIIGPEEKMPEANQITNMLLGRSRYKPQTEGQRRQFMAEGETAARRFENYLETRSPVGNADAHIVEKAKQTLQIERQKVLRQLGANTYMTELEKLLDTKVARGELPASDMDELLTTASVFPHINKAIEHENWLDSLAVKHFPEFPVRTGRNGKEIGDFTQVEAHYNSLIERAQAGKIGREEVEKFRDRIDYATQPKVHEDGSVEALPYDSINELLGPHWKADFRIGDTEARTFLRQARALAGRETKTSRKALETTVNKRKQSYKTFSGLKSKGKDTGFIKENIDRQTGAIGKYEAQIQQQTADLFVRLLKSHLLTREGKQVYGNSAKAQGLKNLIGDISNRLGIPLDPEANATLGMHHGTDSNVTTVGERGTQQTRNADIGEGDLAPQDINERDLNYVDDAGNYDPAILENDVENFQSHEDQLQHMHREANRQLKHLEFDPSTGRNYLEPERNLIDGTPDFFLKEDGSVNRDMLHKAFSLDSFGNLRVRTTGQPEVDQWLSKVEHVLHQDYMNTYERIYASHIRRINEGNQAQREESVLSELGPHGEQIAKMFTVEGNKVKLPKVTLNHQDITIADKESLRQIVTHQDRQRADGLLNTLNKFQNGEEVNHQAFSRLRDYLHGTGKPTPNSPKAVREWLSRSNQGHTLSESMALGINPENIAFQRLFKAQHNLTVGQALIHRDQMLGKTVEALGKKGKEFPGGVTIQQYKFLAQNSLEDFKHLTEGTAFGRFTNMGGETEKAARTAGHADWAERTYKRFMSMNSAQRDRYLTDQFNKALAKENKAKPKVDPELLQKFSQEGQRVKIEKVQYKQFHKQAEKAVFDRLEQAINAHELQAPAGHTALRLTHGLDSNTSVEYINKAIKYRFGQDKADLFTQKHFATKAKDTERLKEIEGRIAQIERQESQWASEHASLVANSRDTVAEFKKRIHEDAILRAATLELANQKTQLGINVMGRALAVPTSEKLFRNVEAFSRIPVIKETRQLFADAFGSPAASLNHEELREARSIALAQAPIIIEHKIRRLQHSMGKFQESDRVQGFKDMLRGTATGDEPITQAIKEGFGDDMVRAFQGKIAIGEDDNFLTLSEINRYLPRELALSEKQLHRGIDTSTTESVIRALTLSKPKNVRIKDPYRMAWLMHIAVEQAKARKAIQYTVKNAFGVKKVTNDSPAFEALRQLPGMGWKESDHIGSSHLFPPQVVGDIDNLFKMLEPHMLSQFGRLADRATGYWKTMTTVYNPGYWTRNGIGETMSSWFAGVNDARVYKKAGDVIKYWRGDGKDLAALGEQFPWLKHTEGRAVKDSDVVLTTAAGHKVTANDLVVLFHDTGLKTGFFNTEFDAQYSKLGDKFRGITGGKLGNAHQAVRSTGEWYEDYFRMAHFIHAMEKTHGSIETAAKHAAAEVRKYHFDYTDFSNFEKTVMLRAFPFYKWTRKALPLMLSLMFTKPGKVMAYPKIANTLSNTVSTGDIANDKNGFAPNYEGIVPGWIQDMWGYQIAEYGSKDAFGQQTESYLNLNTPQFDTYKALTNPGNTSYGLLNPYLKGADQLQSKFTDHSLSEVSGQEPYSGKGISGMLSTEAKNTPQGNFLQKLYNGKMTPEDLTTFLTGIGVYQSGTNRRQQEAFISNVPK